MTRHHSTALTARAPPGGPSRTRVSGLDVRGTSEMLSQIPIKEGHHSTNNMGPRRAPREREHWKPTVNGWMYVEHQRCYQGGTAQHKRAGAPPEGPSRTRAARPLPPLPPRSTSAASRGSTPAPAAPSRPPPPEKLRQPGGRLPRGRAARAAAAALQPAGRSQRGRGQAGAGRRCGAARGTPPPRAREQEQRRHRSQPL